MQSRIEELIREALQTDVEVVSAEVLHTLDHTTVTRVRLNQQELSLIYKASGSPEHLPLFYREAKFYQHLAAHLPAGLCPQAYLVRVEEDACHLILEDIPGTVIEAEVSPSARQVAQFVEALAQLSNGSKAILAHGELWTDTLGTHPYNTIHGRLASYPERLAVFKASEVVTLPASVVAWLDNVSQLENLAELSNPTTIVHGDAHFGNALYRDDGVTLIDWANLALGFGEIDLAHLIALNLPPALAEQYEAELVTLYADLTQQSPESVRHRYRLGLMYALASVIGMWEFGVPNWERLLLNGVAAADRNQADRF